MNMRKSKVIEKYASVYAKFEETIEYVYKVRYNS